MYFNQNISNVFFNRQINVYNLNSIYHSNKIIESIFKSSKKLNYIRKNVNLENYKKIAKNFCFSEDGNYLAADFNVFKFEDDYSLSDSSIVMSYGNNFDYIEGLTFNRDSSKLFSYQYRKFIINDIVAVKTEKIFPVNSKVFCVSNDPLNLNLFTFGCEDGSVNINDLRTSFPEKIYKEKKEIRSLQYHPFNENFLLVTSPCKNGLFTFDIRNRKPIFHYKILYNNDKNALCAKYNKNGDQIYLTRLHLNPVLFESNRTYPVYEFDEYGYSNFYYLNNSSGKNCCFAGPNDEYVVSASEDLNVFMWSIPKKSLFVTDNEKIPVKLNSAKFILKHSSEVYSVGYNYQKSILACSTKSESLKLWSPLKFKLKTDIPEENKFNDDLEKEFLSFTKTRLKEFIHLLSWERTDSCLNEEYFENKCLNVESNNVSFENFIENFENDSNIDFIKIFIDNFEEEKKKKDELIAKSQDAIKVTEKLKKKLLKNNHLSMIFELFKIVSTRNLIKSSVLYLNLRLANLNESAKKFEVLNENKSSTKSLNEKKILESLDTNLNFMKDNLLVILKENEEYNEKAINLMRCLFYSFERFETSSFFKLIKLIANLKVSTFTRNY